VGRISKNVMSDGIDRIPEKVIVEPELVLTQSYWWWMKRATTEFDLSLIDQLELTTDSNYPSSQSVYGSVLVLGVEGCVLYHLRARVPGPFPCVETHAYGSVWLADRQEGMVWILSHELCHFLKRTKQLKGKNTERAACDFADQWLKDFREDRDQLPAVSSL